MRGPGLCRICFRIKGKGSAEGLFEDGGHWGPTHHVTRLGGQRDSSKTASPIKPAPPAARKDPGLKDPGPNSVLVRRHLLARLMLPRSPQCATWLLRIPLLRQEPSFLSASVSALATQGALAPGWQPLDTDTIVSVSSSPRYQSYRYLVHGLNSVPARFTQPRTSQDFPRRPGQVELGCQQHHLQPMQGPARAEMGVSYPGRSCWTSPPSPRDCLTMDTTSLARIGGAWDSVGAMSAPTQQSVGELLGPPSGV